VRPIIPVVLYCPVGLVFVFVKFGNVDIDCRCKRRLARGCHSDNRHRDRLATNYLASIREAKSGQVGHVRSATKRSSSSNIFNHSEAAI
jgi:hypothetical protein